jgi:hypothetical protein
MNFKTIGIVVAVGLVLGVAYYGLSPLFITITVDEALPGASTDTLPRDTESAPPSGAMGGTPAAPPIEIASVAATVVGTFAHPASGTARIVEADGTRYLRYEDFKTINGPDLYIYLAKDLNANEFVSLGLIKATEGNVNYEIPRGVDPSEYRYSLVWCKQFATLFNYADFSVQ